MHCPKQTWVNKTVYEAFSSKICCFIYDDAQVFEETHFLQDLNCNSDVKCRGNLQAQNQALIPFVKLYSSIKNRQDGRYFRTSLPLFWKEYLLKPVSNQRNVSVTFSLEDFPLKELTGNTIICNTFCTVFIAKCNKCIANNFVSMLCLSSEYDNIFSSLYFINFELKLVRTCLTGFESHHTFCQTIRPALRIAKSRVTIRNPSPALCL